MAVKASFNLPEDELNQLRALAKQRNITVTQALRQAISDAQFLQEQVDSDNKILIEEPKGKMREVVLKR